MTSIEDIKRYPFPENDYQIGWNNALSAYWSIGLTNISPSMSELANAYIKKDFERGWKDAMRAIKRW